MKIFDEKIAKKDVSTVKIFGMDIFSKGKDDLLKQLGDEMIKQRKRGLVWVNTPNSEQVVESKVDDVFRSVLNGSTIRIPDGQGLVLASLYLAKRGKITDSITERITGVDLMNDLCGVAEEKNLRVFLLGGRGVVAEFAAQKLKLEYPSLKIEYDSGPENVKTATQEDWFWVLEKIERFGADILFVGFGAGKQEKWVHAYRDVLEKIGVKLVMVVGGAYDMISGNVRRAPGLIQKVGLEWLWRLTQEPWRWKRQLRLFRFWWMVFRYN